MNLGRIIKHFLTGNYRLRRAFTPATLQSIENAIRDSERLHSGEVRFVIEAALDIWPLLHDQTPRERALQIFSEFRVWDTEYNNGVLIYLLLADNDVEIVADRGIAKQVATSEWDQICRDMESRFKQQRFEEGVILGVETISTLLIRVYPSTPTDNNELPDRPAVL